MWDIIPFILFFLMPMVYQKCVCILCICVLVILNRRNTKNLESIVLSVMVYSHGTSISVRKFLRFSKESVGGIGWKINAPLTGCLVKKQDFVCSVNPSCLSLCNPRDCSPPGSSVRGISQARILEWVAISFSGGSSWPRDGTHISYVSCLGRQVLYH